MGRAARAWVAACIWTAVPALVMAQAAPPLAGSEPAAAVQRTAPLLPEVFFGPSEFGEFVASPSGRWLAVALQPGDERRRLAIYDLHGQTPPYELVSLADADIGHFRWVGEDRLVFSLRDQRRGSADQRQGPGLFTVQRDGSGVHQLVLSQWWHNPSRGTRAARRLDASHSLVHVPERQVAGQESVIVWGRRAGDGVESMLKRLNIVTGEVQSLNLALPALTSHLFFSPEGEPLFLSGTDEGRLKVYQRERDAQGALKVGWKLLLDTPAHAPAWTPHAVDRQGQLYVTVDSGPAGEAVLKRYDPATGAPAAQNLVAVPGYDFRGHLLLGSSDAEGAELLGVRVYGDTETAVWLDPQRAALQQAVDTRLPGRVNRVTCRRCRSDDRTVIVWSFADRHPGELWVWRGPLDQPTTWRRVGLARPGVAPARMAEVATTRIAARDGLGLPLWLTLPDVRRPAPAVVLVHGGPWVRGGHWEWDAWAQFLASRGVVVLAPEFRGSAGYGQRHLQAGWRQWGRAMQDDLADTVDWAVKQGLVDPTRVCIVGASYGGYAALMGLVRQPDLFRCAVSWVPVVDLNTLLREGSPDDWDDEVRAFSLPQMVGDWQQDAAALAEVSPLAQVDRIRQPLLLAWGEKDRRADPGPTRRLARALQEAGRPVEAVEYAGEGHHWLKQATRLDFARRVDAFLARHLQLATGAP